MWSHYEERERAQTYLSFYVRVCFSQQAWEGLSYCEDNLRKCVYQSLRRNPHQHAALVAFVFFSPSASCPKPLYVAPFIHTYQSFSKLFEAHLVETRRSITHPFKKSSAAIPCATLGIHHNCNSPRAPSFKISFSGIKSSVSRSCQSLAQAGGICKLMYNHCR